MKFSVRTNWPGYPIGVMLSFGGVRQDSIVEIMERHGCSRENCLKEWSPDAIKGSASGHCAVFPCHRILLWFRSHRPTPRTIAPPQRLNQKSMNKFHSVDARRDDRRSETDQQADAHTGQDFAEGGHGLACTHASAPAPRVRNRSAISSLPFVQQACHAHTSLQSSTPVQQLRPACASSRDLPTCGVALLVLRPSSLCSCSDLRAKRPVRTAHAHKLLRVRRTALDRAANLKGTNSQPCRIRVRVGVFVRHVTPAVVNTDGDARTLTAT